MAKFSYLTILDEATTVWWIERGDDVRYLCLVCGYIYDEGVGAPADGIPAGTAWADVSETWLCPDCGAMKDDFEMVTI